MLSVYSEQDRHFDEKMAIVHSVGSSIANITVTELCRRNGITRNKFYYLFETKDDVFYWFIGYCFARSLSEIGRTLTWREGVALFLESMDLEREFVKASSLGLIQKPKIHRLPYETARANVITETIERYKRREVTPALQLEMTTYIIAEENLSRTWVMPNDFADAEEYVEAWLECVPRGLLEALELKR